MKGTTHTEEERFQDELMFYGEGEKEKREMTEGKGFSDMYRNTSEELFLKSLMENSVGMPVPNMEMLGFKNISSHLHQQHHLNARIDSEELFKTWLTNGENSEYNSSSIVHRTRQASRRISTELANLTNNQPGGPLQKKRSNDVIFSQNDYPLPDTISTDLNHQSIRDAVEKSVQASNLYLAKAWFHSSQPMTRSRSSELRRRYAASMQSGQICIGNGMSNSKQELAYPMHDVGNQLGTFMSPSNSSSSTFNATPQMGDVNRVSSVVNMLKGTLERKKLANNIDKETAQDSCNPIYHGQQIIVNSSFDQGKGNSMSIPEIPQIFQEISSNQVNDGREIDLEGFINSTNPTHQLSTVSREASQSESSAAAPVLSSGFEACDGPSNSSQTLSICESSRKQVENNKTSEIDPRAKDFREQIIENLKDDRKRGGLIRYGSVTSAGSVDKGDTTKKRRVERSRKMAEAKERISTPAIPSDMQSVLKRCENLEKEVRSLKLNLSFMNRKDSEQTKQIEELQKQNEDLADEKERLLEEIERILSETGKM